MVKKVTKLTEKSVANKPKSKKAPAKKSKPKKPSDIVAKLPDDAPQPVQPLAARTSAKPRDLAPTVIPQLEKLPDGLVQIPFRRLQVGAVFFLYKREYRKISSEAWYVTVGRDQWTGETFRKERFGPEYGLADIVIPENLNPLERALLKETRFRINEYQNILAYPVSVIGARIDPDKIKKSRKPRSLVKAVRKLKESRE